MNCPRCNESIVWININKRVPEVGQRVLVWAKPIGEIGFPFILVYEGDGITNALSIAGNMAIMSHWMPLPDSPFACNDKGNH